MPAGRAPKAAAVQDNTSKPKAELVTQAEDALARGDYAVAREHLARAIQREPLKAEYPAMLASILVNTGEEQAALVYARQAVALAPQATEHQLALGEIYEALRAREMARTAFLAATRLEPAQPRPWIALARLERENGELRQAEMHARRACTVAPDNAEAQEELGKALQARGQLTEAAAVFRLAVQAAPTQALFLFNLGAVLAEAHETAEALTVLRQAVERKPSQAGWLALLACVEKATGHDQAAQDALDRACSLEPDQAAEFKHRYDAGLAPATAVPPGPVEMFPSPLASLEAAAADGGADAYHSLSLAYIRAGRVREALAAARRAEESRTRAEAVP
jgi:Flp pilus assembly protein TadD